MGSARPAGEVARDTGGQVAQRILEPTESGRHVLGMVEAFEICLREAGTAGFFHCPPSPYGQNCEIAGD